MFALMGVVGMGLVWGALLSRVVPAAHPYRSIFWSTAATLALSSVTLVFSSVEQLTWFAVGLVVSLVSHLIWRRRLAERVLREETQGEVVS